MKQVYFLRSMNTIAILALLLFSECGRSDSSFEIISVRMFASHVYDNLSDGGEYINPYLVENPVYEYKEISEWNGAEKSSRPSKFDVAVFMRRKSLNYKINNGGCDLGVSIFREVRIGDDTEDGRYFFEASPHEIRKYRLKDNDWKGGAIVSVVLLKGIPVPLEDVCEGCSVSEVKASATVSCEGDTPYSHPVERSFSVYQ